MKRLLIILALLVSPAVAGEVQIPTEEEKIAALKLAYRLNGNSMVGHNMMIDLTDPVALKSDRIIAAVPERPEVIPAEDAVWPKVEKPKQVADICARHGKRKIVRGNSWKCSR